MSQAVFATSRAIDKNTMAEFRRFSSYYFPYINKLQYKLKPSLMFDSNEFQKSSVNMNKGASALHMYSPIKRLIINEFSKIWTHTNKKCIKKAINNHMRAKRRKMCSMPGSLRDTFKNSKIAKTAAALTVAVPTALAAFGGAASDAHAGDGKISFLKFNPNHSAALIHTSGVSASRDMVAITIYSGDDNMLRAAYLEALDVEKDTEHNVYFLQAPSQGPITKAVIMANGLQIGVVRNGGNPESFREDLREIIDRAGQELASVQKPKDQEPG